jgi:signal transduction histidine kinase
MEQNKDLILFIVIASSAVVLLLAGIVFDILLLYRKRKLIAEQDLELHQKRIDELIRKQELASVNALLKGQNAERRRISQELHDRLGGMLFMAKQYFKQLDNKIRELQKEQEDTYNKFSGLLDEVVDEVRRISHDLYEGSLEKFGYSIALKQLIAAIKESNEVKIDFRFDVGIDKIDLDTQHELYAITQEMLSNTLKHARATEIEIYIDREDEHLICSYRDNGIGFDPEASHEGIGLENIDDRVKKIGGSLRLETAPGEGTSYLLTLPISDEDKSEHRG